MWLGLVRFDVFWLELVWLCETLLGWDRLEMARLGFSLVWFVSVWFISLFEKMAEKIPAGENSREKT